MLRAGLKSRRARSKRRMEASHVARPIDRVTGTTATQQASGPHKPPSFRLTPGAQPLEGTIVTRALRSHQLWLTVAYFGLLSLMARGFAS